MPHQTALFLDDDDERHEEIGPILRERGFAVEHVHTFREAALALLRQRFDEVWLDFDLNFNQYRSVHNDGTLLTGVDVARCITQLLPTHRPGRIVIHSRNERGAKQIERMLMIGRGEFVAPTERTPFGGSYCDVA